MGMEMVEIFMGIEECFDIKVPDEDIYRLHTVGDIHRYLCRRVLNVRHRTCETQRRFYQLRRTLMRVSDLPRWYVRPSTRLDLALPAKPALRRQAVRRLSHETGIAFDNDVLKLPYTVASLVRLSVASDTERRIKSFAMPPGGWTEQTVWLALQQIFVKQTEIAEEKITYDARFVEDLDLG